MPGWASARPIDDQPYPQPDVGDPAAAFEHGLDLRDRRQVVPGQRTEEERPVRRRLGLPGVGAQLRPADAAAGPVGGGQRAQVRPEPGDDPGQREHVVRAEHVGEHLGRAGRQPVAAVGGVGVRIGHGEHTADGLVFEPLAGVALGASGAAGQLGRGEGRAVGQHAVEAEPVAEVDGLHELGAEHGAEEPLAELGGGGGGLGN